MLCQAISRPRQPVCKEIAVMPPIACSRSDFVISKPIPARLSEPAWTRKVCNDVVQRAPPGPPQGSSMWNESLQTQPSCNRYLATVRHSPIDSAPHLSTAQCVCLPVLTAAHALPFESSPCYSLSGESTLPQHENQKLQRHINDARPPQLTGRESRAQRWKHPPSTKPQSGQRTFVRQKEVRLS